MTKANRLAGGADQSKETIALAKRIERERSKGLRELALPATRRIGEARMVMVAAMEDVLELLNTYARRTDD